MIRLAAEMSGTQEGGLHARRIAQSDLVDETMKLAREFQGQSFEAQHLAAAVLFGFALALLLGPRARRERD